MCSICDGIGLLLADTCPLCDGVCHWPEDDGDIEHRANVTRNCSSDQFFAEAGDEGLLLVAPNPLLTKEWGKYVHILTSYSLSDSHPEQPKRFLVAMEEGVLPIAMLPENNILFPRDPADFFSFGSEVHQSFLAAVEETRDEDLESKHPAEGRAHIHIAQNSKEQCSTAIMSAVGLDEKCDTLLGRSMSPVRRDDGKGGADMPPIQIALALAHEAFFHELDATEASQQMIEDSAEAEQRLVRFAQSAVTLDTFLQIVLHKVADATVGFAKASWLATETVLSMAMRLTRDTPTTRNGKKLTHYTKIRGTEKGMPKNKSTANLKYGVAVVRPAGHHSGATLKDFSLSAFCGLNHVLTAASYLAYEGKRVLVIDVDAHFARGSQQIALAVNKKLALLGKPRILMSDISSALYQGEVAKEAARDGQLVFTTNPRGAEEMEKLAHANWFPPAHLKDGEVNDAWLCFALLRTLLYSKDFGYFSNSQTGTTVLDETAHSVDSAGPDVILISLGLDAAKGEPDPEDFLTSCTCLGYAMMAEILKKHGVPIVFALEGGGYRYARDLKTMGEKVFPGLLVEEVSSTATSRGSPAEPSLKAIDPARLFEGAVEMDNLQTALCQSMKGEGSKGDEAEIVAERRKSHEISIFGGNLQAVIRVLGGHFEWGTYDPAGELRSRVRELEVDLATLAAEEMKSSSVEDTPIEEARRNVELKGKQIQEAIENIYKANGLYVDKKAMKKNNQKITKKMPKKKV